MTQSTSLHRRKLSAVAVLTLALPLSAALADDGKTRYVSGDGRDTGDCLNRFRPCRSLSYAVAKAGKADTIRVAEGNYAVRNAQQLLDVLSINGRVAAGYSKYSGYSERNATQKTFLTGVPPEFRERFEAAGFSVIVDAKGVSAEETQLMRKVAAQVTASERSHASTPCVGNQSVGFACQSVGLQRHMGFGDLQPASARGNDVWGFTDLNTQREYAIMGLQNGIAIVDITDPQAPEQVGSVSGSSTTWRDITVYQRYDAPTKRWRAYAYVTADAVSDFLMVVDLSKLPNDIEQVSFSSDFRSAHTNYLVNADYTYGLATSSEMPQLGIAGGSTNGGNHRLYALDNPRSPRLLSVSPAGYAHDLGSVAISDARKNTQCFNAQSLQQCQVLTDFNENTVDVWDVSNPSSPRQLASHPYTNASYVHSGFWTEDANYLFVHDELDEQNFGLSTTVRVFDMSNLRAPTLAGTWVGFNRSIDHNGATRGNRYYVAHYSEGLTVLDISNPRAPQRIGYFDTYPPGNQTGFVGAWSVYPFFESGTIAIGDINSGLYLLRNDTLGSNNGTLGIVDTTLAGTEGQSVDVAVSRTGGFTGAVSVQLDLLPGSTDAADVTLASQLLTWADGDTQTKTATLNLTADSQSENLELALVRLRNPQGGATVALPEVAKVAVADAGRTTRLRLLESSPTVNDARGKVFVTVTRQNSATGEARVSYRTLPSSQYDGFTATQGELVWADGDTASKIVTVTLDPARLSGGQTTSFQLELFGADNAELETSTGDTASSVLATIAVRDGSASTTPPTNAPRVSSGGGGNSAAWLALLAVFAALRFSLSRSSSRSPAVAVQARTLP